jgi:predicted AlkP superfamily pyrophosphatase or phosphodiesterase
VNFQIKRNKKILYSILLGLFIFNFFIGPIAFHVDNIQDENIIERTILFSLDSCNSEYLNNDWMPKLYNLLKHEGVIFKTCWASVAAETMLGHTTMLTGCNPNSSGVIGNGLYNVDTGEEIRVIQDPKYRLVDTMFENLEKNNIIMKTGFVSGKWRLPKFLSQNCDFIFASPVTGIPLPPGYESILGAPIINIEGDMYDQWTMRALTELIYQEDPEFIFVNLAWLDDSGHDTGSFNLNHKRELRQLDDLIYQFMTDLKAMNKYKNTLFIFTADHGMDTIKGFFNPLEYLENAGIDIFHIHWEGHCAFIYLENPADINTTVNLLKKHEKVAISLPYNELNQLHLDTYKNRTGDVFISCQENIVVKLGDLPLIYFGMHGGVSTRDIPLAFMGPKIKKQEFIQDQIPGLEDIVPTLYYLWGINNSALTFPKHVDGRILYEIIA